MNGEQNCTEGNDMWDLPQEKLWPMEIGPIKGKIIKYVYHPKKKNPYSGLALLGVNVLVPESKEQGEYVGVLWLTPPALFNVFRQRKPKVGASIGVRFVEELADGRVTHRFFQLCVTGEADAFAFL